MGAGSSAAVSFADLVRFEGSKPHDGSDVNTPRGKTARAEVSRLRKILHDKAAGMKAAPDDATKDAEAVAMLEAMFRVDELYVALRHAVEDDLTDEERAAAKAQRRKLLRAGAEEHAKKMEVMTEEELKRAQNQGELELYDDESLAKREDVRECEEVRQVLDKWWRASRLYDDKDGSDALDRGEYAEFYKRMAARLVNADDDPDNDMTDEEIQAAMAEDFTVDAGDDGQVTELEFKNAVFSLGDIWTDSCTVKEYTTFLTRAYKKVFEPVQSVDKVLWPKSFRKFTKAVKRIKKLPKSAACEIVTEIYREKIRTDKAAKKAGKGCDSESVSDTTIRYLKQKYGDPVSARKLHALITTINEFLHCGAGFDDTQDSWLLLYARLCGAKTPVSGRLVPMPDEAGHWMLEVLEGCERILEDTAKRLPKQISSTMEQRIVSGRNRAAIGLMDHKAAGRYFRDVAGGIGVTEVTRPKLMKMLVGVFANLCDEIEVPSTTTAEFKADGRTESAEASYVHVHDTITAVEFMVLCADMWCAELAPVLCLKPAPVPE